MNKISPLIFILVCLPGCSRPEAVDVADINADRSAMQDRKLQIVGEAREPKGYTRYISVGPARYFVLNDGTGGINVWYDSVRMHCPPYPGSAVRVTGKIKPAGSGRKLVFMARTISFETETGPDAGTVRLCALSAKEQKIFAREGPEGLKKHWRQLGSPTPHITTK